MMDKKTIWVVVGCIIAMLLAQRVIDKLYPPHPKAAMTSNATGTAQAPVATNNVVSAQQTSVPNAAAPSVNATPKESPSQPQQPRPTEQVVSLSNDFVQVDFTSWGGGVRSVELLKHKTAGDGPVVLNGTNLIPALSLTGVAGAGSNDVYTLQITNANTVVMRSGNGVAKTVTLSNDYVMSVSVQMPMTDAASGTIGMVVGTVGPTQPREMPNYLVVDWAGASKFRNRTLPRIADREKAGKTWEAISTGWVAVKSQYFTMVLTPVTNITGVTCDTVNLSTSAPPATIRGVMATADVPMTRSADGTESCSFTFYTGPKDYDRLESLGKDQQELMDFGTPLDFYSGLFGIILLRSLNFFYRLIPNYGVAIILVTVAIKVIFWPIQAKSIQSMKAMQKFQPLMNKLREKYKDDPQRLNTEMMKLYKEHKINPFSGCLPMVVQLPVLYAIYRVLLNAIALRGAPFLWIHDLAQPDTIATIAGLPINPLPIAMTAGTFMQQKMTPTGGDPQQQKMMMFMPIMMLFFFYRLAAGLTLYYTLQQGLSVLQQWRSMRQRAADSTAAPASSAGKLK